MKNDPRVEIREFAGTLYTPYCRDWYQAVYVLMAYIDRPKIKSPSQKGGSK